MHFRPNLIFGLAIAAFTFSCQSPGGTTLEADISGAEELLLAKIGTDEIEYQDTLHAVSGTFSYSFEDIEEAELWMLEVPNGTRLSLFVEPDQQIALEADANDPGYEYSIEGSPGSERILNINRIMAGLMSGLDSLNNVNSESVQLPEYTDIRERLDSTYGVKMNAARDAMLAMLDEDPGHLTNLFIFPMAVGNRQLIPAQDYFDRYESSMSAMQERYPGNPHVERFAQRMDQMKAQVEAQRAFQEAEAKTAVGQISPDIVLPDPNGTERKLSDLRGKVVLVDFWAAWCRPCRAENPNVVRMYNAYKDKGFDIYSVSLDGLANQPNAKSAWTNAIDEDGLVWENHVSDLKGWEADATRTFGFQSIPFTLLLDRDGTILARGLRGPQLEAAIVEAL